MLTYAFSPRSTIIHGNPKEIADSLLPPVSKGDHYLKVPNPPTQYVWLFGAYNNGRKEENVLVENDGQIVRYRAFWLNSDHNLWCLDVSLANAEWKALTSDLKKEHVSQLPNLVPHFSHAMTYRLKLDLENEQHEACAYGIESMHEFDMSRADKRYVNNWRNTISKLLAFRETFGDQIRSASFTLEGTVDWNSTQETDASLTEILRW